MTRDTYMELASPLALRALMEQRGFSTERLARYAGCSKSFIVHLRVGRKKTCSPLLGARIAEALDVPESILFLRKMSGVNRPCVPVARMHLAAA